MKNNTYVVIMAGGIGSRFWPLSKSTYPKQFLDILGTGKTFLQETAERFLTLCPYENMIIVTNQEYKKIVVEQLPLVPEKNILLEPMRKNTAPCIAYANAFIKNLNSNANIIVSPADHLILHNDKFIQIIKTGLDFISSNNALLTIGIKPSRPETGYGYIQVNHDEKNTSPIMSVKTFTEKPNYELAQFFLKSGDFFWNSGIFIWNIKTIDQAFEKNLPEVYHLFNEFSNNPIDNEKSLSYIYSECPNVSIDYGIMEKADNVYVIKSDFGWSDLGTWGSLFENLKKDKENNIIRSKHVYIQNSSNNFIQLPNEKIAVINSVSNLIIVEHENMLLISDKDKEQEIKTLVNQIKLK
ncbi:MAG TPA: mannose-1-phosphate guanylyltransferase [Bacteroidales bacterium]|jgi:mannose-1-phosphate guanylyltransferase|nr:mannose-1-phosphate guanylyltransferase [Bacteroidales bacterium]HOU98143.1 mannose-1-phosphate guanylyltransferase [Bacteroidales bacterium]